MGLGNRLAMIRAYAGAEPDARPTLTELFRGLLRAPSSVRAPRQIRDMTIVEGYLVVHLAGVERPLYWPNQLPLHDLHMVIAEAYCEDDWHYYEVPETRVLPGDTVLDCGAAEGLFSLRVAPRAGRTIVFEPSPIFTASLERTFAGASGVTIVPHALGAREGRARLAVGSLTSRLDNANHGIAVRVTTIDQWVREAGGPVDFIKADLEGFELEVLRGAEETIAECRPRIAVTCYHPGNEWRDMLRYCKVLVPSYRHRVKGLSFLDGRRSRPVMLHLWAD
jgi:FkbM family methyltransferase